MKLSPTQLDVLAKMRAAGGRIERWPGGFWTTPGTEAVNIADRGKDYQVPEWYAGISTLRALEKAGMVAEAERKGSRDGASFIVAYRLVS